MHAGPLCGSARFAIQQKRHPVGVQLVTFDLDTKQEMLSLNFTFDI